MAIFFVFAMATMPGEEAGRGKKATIPHATKKVKLTDSFHEVLRKFLSSNEKSFALPWVGGHYSGVLRTKSSRSSIERSPRSEETDAEERDRLYYCHGLGRH